METKTKVPVGVEYDSEAQANLTVPLGERELYPHPAMKIAAALQEHEVHFAFGSPGGHIWPMLDEISRIGINLITFGHEQNAIYAAEAYAQVSRKIGVGYGTAGPGMLNTIPSVNQAFLNQTPMLLLYGAHDIDTDGQYRSLQEGYAVQVVGSMTKVAHRVIHPNSVKGHMTRGIQMANAAPRGPVAFEMTIGMLLTTQQAAGVLGFGAKKGDDQYTPDWRMGKTAQTPSGGPGEPEDIAQALELIQNAKAPAVLIGDGAMWCDAGAEIEELVTLLKLPFCGRRLGKGVVSDNHPNSVRGKVPFSKECDLLITFGTKVGSFDNYGRGWPQTIQVNESVQQFETFLKSPVTIQGNIKSVAKNLLQQAKAQNLQAPASRDAWISKLRQLTEDANKRRRDKAMHYGFEHPHYKQNDFIHFGYVGVAVADYLEEKYQSKARVVVDGYTISDYAPPFLKATRPAQIISSGDQGGVGHGVGQAIGAMMAQLEQGDRTPVLALMGDSGMGNAGPDIEVAARYKLPIVYLVTNNNGWMPAHKYYVYGKDWEALGPSYAKGEDLHGVPALGQERLPQDWAAMARSLGCWGDTVRRSEDLMAALDRAFSAAESGQTAVLDVIMDPSLTNRAVSTAGYTLMYANIPWEELTPRGKALRKATLSWAFPKLANETTIVAPDPWEPGDGGEA